MIVTEYSPVASTTATRSFAADVCIDLDCSVSLAVFIMLKYDDFQDFKLLECKPRNYADVESFERNYRAWNLLRKSKGILPDGDCKNVAATVFVRAELANRVTNRFFTLRRQGVLNFKSRDERILFYARCKISDILSKKQIWVHDAGFGPGASSNCKGENTHLLCKTASNPSCSRELWPRLRAYLTKCETYVSSIIGQEVSGPCSILNGDFMDYNTLTFVPKDFKTDRVIAIEPDGNIFFQKMLGNWIRSCLKAEGLDLNNRQPVNARLARKGSLDDSFATIDFESASDMISTGLVNALLPGYAFSILDDARSKFTKLPTGVVMKNEKFSSMGNGFTFELETLIFYGLLFGVYKELGIRPFTYDSPSCNITVFGDDVVCRSEAADLFIEVCQTFGFKPNLSKTFLKGDFRESCGHDYFKGIQIICFRLKELIRNDLARIDVANRLRTRFAVSDFSDNSFKRTWYKLIKPIRKELKNFGPFNSFNTVIWTSVLDMPYRRDFEFDRTWINVPIAIPRLEKRVFSPSATFAAHLYRAPYPLSFSKRGYSTSVKIRRRSIDYLDQTMGGWFP